MAAWSFTEDRLLVLGVEKYGLTRWYKVSASMLSHKRSKLECKERFHHLLEPLEWSLAEDKKLNDLVRGFGSSSMWSTIGMAMKKSANSCFARYVKLTRERNEAAHPSVITQNVAPIPKATPKLQKVKLENKVLQPLGRGMKRKRSKQGMRLKVDLED